MWCCRCIILRIFLQVRRPRPPDGVPGPSRLGGQGGVLSGIFQHFLENKGNPAQKKSLLRKAAPLYRRASLLGPQAALEAVLGGSWGVLGRYFGRYWVVLGVLGMSWASLGGSWGGLGGSWGLQGRSWAGPGRLLGGSWGAFGGLGGVLESDLEPSGASWRHLENSLIFWLWRFCGVIVV